MALTRDAYRELEDIVGSEYISEDRAVLEPYSFAGFGGGTVGSWRDNRFLPNADAVVLPGSTEDVQAIIKLCNRRRIKSKAFSTGYGANGSVGTEGGILLDMRRLNRILLKTFKGTLGQVSHPVVDLYNNFGRDLGQILELNDPSGIYAYCMMCEIQ